MNANSGNFCFGFSEILVLLPANNASVIFMVLAIVESVGKDIIFYLNYYEIMMAVLEILLNLLR
jgi:hypothetical protein